MSSKRQDLVKIERLGLPFIRLDSTFRIGASQIELKKSEDQIGILMRDWIREIYDI